MEEIMSCFFDDFYSKIDRGYLSARYRRQMLTEYISTVIAGCTENSEYQVTCKEAVLSAIRYHQCMKTNNNNICLLGKNHNVLYIAIKLCYDWKLEDSNVVSILLNEIYQCEKSFERLVGGAIFGVKLCQMVSGWKSDFNNREENVKALIYFIEHSYKSKSVYNVQDVDEKFVDVPLDCCGGTLPIWVCLQAGTYDVLHLMISYGAKLDITCDSAIHYAKKLTEYSSLSSFSDDSKNSLLLILKVIKCLNCPIDLPNFLPDYSTSKTTASLKHLSRIAIRDCLTENFQLPHGLHSLPLPSELFDYLNLTTD